MSKLKFVLYLIIPISSFAQNISQIDSLLQIILKCKNDTELINLNTKLLRIYEITDVSKATELSLRNLNLSKKNNFKLYDAYERYAYNLFIRSNYKESLQNFQLAEKEALKISNVDTKNLTLANIYDGMASVYSHLQNHAGAISSIKKSIGISIILKDEDQILRYNANLANHYFNNQELEKALEHYSIAEKGYIKLNNSKDLINVYNGLGNVYFEKKDYKKSLEFFEKSYKLILKYTPDDLSNIAIAQVNIGETYSKMGNNFIALEYCLKAQDLFRKLENKTSLYITYENISHIYSNLKEYQKSNEYLQKYVALKDSIFDEDTKNTIHEMSIKYESDKKEKENEVLTFENKNKKLVIYFTLGGCVLLLGLVFFIFKGYKNKQKAHKELEVKNEIINHQKNIVEEQHQDITDSIKYAQRIQGAILPPKNIWDKILPNSFVLYMPKDILSGDFYWIEETKDYIYVAAADCTGHGVPGALISIINFNLLNKAVLEKNLVTPSEILDAVNLWLTESLHQTIGESTVKDGMDVALIAINKHSNEVLFAGANNPIYVVSKEELKHIKGDKFPVGAFVEDQIQKFTTKRFTVNKGDTIYLFSDGYTDQFGGDKGKKYKYSPFQEKLKAINNLPLTEQSDKMEEEFIKWKGNHEQVDDVLLIGIKII